LYHARPLRTPTGAMTPATALRCPAGGRGPKPPAGASRPPGRALASVFPGPTGLRGTVPPGRATALSPPQWQGPSPLPQCCAGIRTGRGPKAPGQRPPRPRRALHARRVGRWPLLVQGLPVYRAPSRAGGGNAGRVSCSRPNGRQPHPASMAGAIAPATAPRRDQDQPGAKAPGQRPPRHRRALRTRRVGRWPLFLPDLPVCRAPSRAGGGNAMRFLFPPGRATAPSPPQWQGPSPLP